MPPFSLPRVLFLSIYVLFCLPSPPLPFAAFVATCPWRHGDLIYPRLVVRLLGLRTLFFRRRWLLPLRPKFYGGLDPLFVYAVAYYTLVLCLALLAAFLYVVVAWVVALSHTRIWSFPTFVYFPILFHLGFCLLLCVLDSLSHFFCAHFAYTCSFRRILPVHSYRSGFLLVEFLPACLPFALAPCR